MQLACKNSFSLLVLGMALVCLVDLASSANAPQECSVGQLQKSGDQLCKNKGFFAGPCKLVIDQFVQIFNAVCSTSSAIGGSAGDTGEVSSTVSPSSSAAPA